MVDKADTITIHKWLWGACGIIIVSLASIVFGMHSTSLANHEQRISDSRVDISKHEIKLENLMVRYIEIKEQLMRIEDKLDKALHGDNNDD